MLLKLKEAELIENLAEKIGHGTSIETTDASNEERLTDLRNEIQKLFLLSAEFKANENNIEQIVQVSVLIVFMALFTTTNKKQFDKVRYTSNLNFSQVPIALNHIGHRRREPELCLRVGRILVCESGSRLRLLRESPKVGLPWSHRKNCPWRLLRRRGGRQGLLCTRILYPCPWSFRLLKAREARAVRAAIV